MSEQTTTQIALYQGEDGPIAIVTGEQQPGDRRVIARLDMPYGTLSLSERAAYAALIVKCVNERDSLIMALEDLVAAVQPMEGAPYWQGHEDLLNAKAALQEVTR